MRKRAYGFALISCLSAVIANAYFFAVETRVPKDLVRGLYGVVSDAYNISGVVIFVIFISICFILFFLWNIIKLKLKKLIRNIWFSDGNKESCKYEVDNNNTDLRWGVSIVVLAVFSIIKIPAVSDDLLLIINDGDWFSFLMSILGVVLFSFAFMYYTHKNRLKLFRHIGMSVCLLCFLNYFIIVTVATINVYIYNNLNRDFGETVTITDIES